LLTVVAALALAVWRPWSGREAPWVATTPTDLAGLGSLEARVQAITRKVSPAIVAVQEVDPHGKNYASGVIITADGLVLSQFHVSHRYPWTGDEPERSRRPGERSTVILADGREIEAELLGADQTHDLSVLRLLEPGPYPCVSVNPETEVQLGDWVMKFGHPTGYRRDRPPVVRLGRVLYRDNDRLVTDCHLTGGDSGGPIIDLDGQFVGIVGNSEIHPKLKITNIPRPEPLFNVNRSSLVHRCLPSMIRSEMPPRDTKVYDFDTLFPNANHSLPMDHWTQGSATAQAFRGLPEHLRSNVVEVHGANGRPSAVGTIVDPDGWILTVASLLPAEPKCRLPDEQVVPATVVGVNPDFDVALLKVGAANLRGVEWAGAETTAGTILAAPSASPTTARPFFGVGIVSVATRDLPGPYPKQRAHQQFKAQPPGVFGTPTAVGLRIDRLDVISADSGIRVGDILVSMGETSIRTQDDVAASVAGLRPGDSVMMRVLRGEESLEFSVVLGAALGIWSKPYGALPTLFEHDMLLLPSQCGGPVVNLDGKAVGITVYRGKYGCLAIPASCLERLLPELRSGGLTDPDQHPSDRN
jgi:serine protease Do